MLVLGKALVPLLLDDLWLLVSFFCLRWKLKVSGLLKETSSAMSTSSCWWLLGGWKLQGQSWPGPAAERCLWKVRMSLSLWNTFCSMPSEHLQLMQGNREVRLPYKMISVSFHPNHPSEKLVLHPPMPLKEYAPFNAWDEEQEEDKRWKRGTLITVGSRSYSALN